MSRDDGQRIWFLWFLAFLGPLTWFFDHSAGWALGPPAHRSIHLDLVRGMHVGLLVVTFIGAILSARELARLRGDDDGDIRRERSRLIAIAGLALGALSTLLIAGNLIASLLLNGQEP